MLLRLQLEIIHSYILYLKHLKVSIEDLSLFHAKLFPVMKKNTHTHTTVVIDIFQGINGKQKEPLNKTVVLNLYFWASRIRNSFDIPSLCHIDRKWKSPRLPPIRLTSYIVK